LSSFESEKIVELIEKRRVLEVIKDAMTKNITDTSILKRDFGLSDDEIKWFLNEVAKGKIGSISHMIPLIDRKLTEIKNELLTEFSRMLEGYKIYLFTDWRKLIRATWAGAYRGKNVLSIEDSKVVILSVDERVLKSITGAEYMFILGPGIYYVKFMLEGYPSPIEYFRVIHSIIMPVDIFSKAMSSPSRTFGKFAEYYRKHLATILLDFYWRMPNEAKSLARLYARIINENKSVFELFLKAIRRSETAPATEDDLEFLSLMKESYNRIITTPRRIRYLADEIEAGIPGMLGFEGTLNKFKDLWAIISVPEVLKKLNDAQQKFIKYGWDILLEITPR